jgi:nitrite reductase/ring-hydroxylating ferredoxin subunit/uncharacterized membrane protein
MRQGMQPLDLADRIERTTALDRIAEPLAGAVRDTLPTGALRDLLHGVPLGHPLHPALVQLPVGAFSCAALLDLTPRTGAAVPTLLTTGILSSLPAAVAGLADWSQMQREQQRVGLVHAGLNTVALGLYVGSVVARTRRCRARGRALSLAGLATLTASAFLGGHLAYRQAAGVNRTAHVPYVLPRGWQDLCPTAELPEGQFVRRDLAGEPLVVRRVGERVDVLYGRCSHLSGPLYNGTLVLDDAGRECVQCPWHGTTFRLGDGSVFRGPGTAPQPVFESRIEDGRVRVRLPGE